MLGEIIIGSVIANWWTGTGRNTDKFINERQLNSALSNFKTELNKQFDDLHREIVISRNLQLLSTLPNAQFDLTTNVLVIPTAEHKLLIVDSKTFDRLLYDVDQHTIEFNEVYIDSTRAKTIKLKTIDLTLTFDEAGELINIIGNLPKPGKDCTYPQYYEKEVKCHKHNRTRLRQLLACKLKHAQDRCESRNKNKLYEQVLTESSSYFTEEYIDRIAKEYNPRLYASYLSDKQFWHAKIAYQQCLDVIDRGAEEVPLGLLLYRKMHGIVPYVSPIYDKYNNSACKRYFEQVYSLLQNDIQHKP